MIKAMTRILVADNNEDSLKNIAEILREAQYPFVVFATNPSDAQMILNGNQVDLAILDLRLTNDAPEDISGLVVAKDTDPSIPKIIVTEYPDLDTVRKALGADVDGLPAAIAFVHKGELATALLPAVELALEIRKTWFRRTQDEISRRLSDDYIHARRVAQVHTWTSFALSIVFAFPIIYGVFKLHSQGALTMVFIFIGSLGAEMTNYIFARKLEFLYRRVDRFHTEYLQVGRFEQLLAVSEEIKEEPARKQFRAKVLDAALARWIGTSENQSQLPPQDD